MNQNHRQSMPRPSLQARSNILGATGLSRACLGGVFAERGLFGADSELTAAEQAALYAEIRLPAGAVPPVRVASDKPASQRSESLCAVGRAVLRRDLEAQQHQMACARRFGVPPTVLAEVARVVETAVFLYDVGSTVRGDAVLATVPPSIGANDGVGSRAFA